MGTRRTSVQNAAEARAAQRGCAIVPAYQEAERIGAVVRAIGAHVAHIVVVDDGSTDGTAEEAAKAGAAVVRHEQNQGKGVALSTGFGYARENGFDYVITIDADGQHDPKEIPRFIEAYVRTGIPVLIGNRMWDTSNMPLVRRCTNLFMSWLLSRRMRQYVPDTQCGYRLYRTDVLPFITAQARRYAAESEVLLHVAERGIRIDNVLIAAIYADQRSKIHPVADTVRFFLMLLRYQHSRRKKRRTLWR
ncbi:MAG: glycosyltransferase family 2 protein [Kiritimatiellae bacterium]|nr:glycosyltransferase family 2 protein [Kiritimatiellia bacterium]